MTKQTMQAEPYEFEFDPRSTALVIIDMQRDFVEPGGFGEALGNDVSPLQAVIAPCKRMLDAARAMGMMVIHTREGHSPDLAIARPQKSCAGDARFASATRTRWGVSWCAANTVTTSPEFLALHLPQAELRLALNAASQTSARSG
jgi:nicotinamidase-related amidase